MSAFDYADVVADLKERRMLIDRAIESLEALMPGGAVAVMEPPPAAESLPPVPAPEPLTGTASSNGDKTPPVLLSQRPLPPDDGIDISSPVTIAKRTNDAHLTPLKENAIDTVVAEALAPKRRGPWRPCPNPKCGKWRRGLSGKCVHCGAKGQAVA